MKLLATIIILLMYLSAFSQQILEIQTIDQVSNTILVDVEVRLIGTDGSTEEKITNENGVATFILKPKTSYSISAFKPKYYTTKGKETTFFKEDSVILNQIIELEPSITFHEGFTKIDLDSTYSYHDINLKNDTIILIDYDEYYEWRSLKEKPILLIRNSEIGYSTPHNKSKLEIELIDTSLVQITKGQLKAKYWIIGYSNCQYFWYELIKEN